MQPYSRRIPERILRLPAWLAEPPADEILQTGLHAPFWGIENLNDFAETPDIITIEIGLKLSATALCLLRMQSEEKAILFPFHLQDFCIIWNESGPNGNQTPFPVSTVWLEPADTILQTITEQGSIEVFRRDHDILVRTGRIEASKPTVHQTAMLTFADFENPEAYTHTEDFL